jgi:hypothetical protein
MINNVTALQPKDALLEYLAAVNGSLRKARLSVMVWSPGKATAGLQPGAGPLASSQRPLSGIALII